MAAQSGRSRFEAPFVWPAHEILSRYATSTTIQLFLRPLENNYPVIPTSPLCGLRFQVVHRQTSFRVRGGSRSEVSAMGDRRKCQTYAASPAEPGGLPVMLAVLLERARRKTIRIWAEQSPFDLKDELKKRGYRWNDGADGRPRSWYIDVDEASQANEIEFLRTTIYLRNVEPRIQAMSAINRFSNRA